jgi:hypothetical protein
MAQFQNVGNPVTIAPGATHLWEFWFGPGLDVGAALATPNLLDSDINIWLTTSDLGVREVQSGKDEGGPLIHYTVAIHNKGTVATKYNLDLGNFL